MTWAAAALVDPHPTNALSDVLKTLCGVEPTRNWSFVENIPPWGLNEVQTMTLSNWDAGDTFKLVFDGQTSAAISYASDISAALTAALNAMDANNTSSITVGRTSATIYTFTAQSAYKYSNLDWDAAGITLGNHGGHGRHAPICFGCPHHHRAERDRGRSLQLRCL